jgi:NitT/TauT family transport system substrate-binding protein
VETTPEEFDDIVSLNMSGCFHSMRAMLPAMIAQRYGKIVNDGALKLFPAFCKFAKIDCTKVTITNMQPNLREQMLMQGQVDGVFGYVNTIRFSAKLIGADPDKQIRFINYGDYGMDLYSNR